MAGKDYIITDWEVSAGSGLRHHQVALCLLLALSAPPKAIFELLPGLTPGQLAMLSQNRVITDAVAGFKDRFLGENASDQFQRYMPKVFETFTAALSSDEIKLEKRLEAAKWIAEKVTGKARQEMELTGGATILQLLSAMDQLRAESRKPELSSRASGIIDVTPQKKDPLAEWVTENVTELKSEKGIS